MAFRAGGKSSSWNFSARWLGWLQARNMSLRKTDCWSGGSKELMQGLILAGGLKNEISEGIDFITSSSLIWEDYLYFIICRARVPQTGELEERDIRLDVLEPPSWVQKVGLGEHLIWTFSSHETWAVRMRFSNPSASGGELCPGNQTSPLRDFLTPAIKTQTVNPWLGNYSSLNQSYRTDPTKLGQSLVK